MGLLSAARRGIRAFHGSPHDFDRFSLAHIGKGEGAQAYGHGLYFAEAEDVARSYRDNLASRASELTWNGQPAVRDAIEQQLFQSAKEAGATTGDDSARMIADNIVQGMIEGDSLDDMVRFVRSSDWDADTKASWISALLNARDNLRVTTRPGRMYEVRINAEPEEFLDWDAPLSMNAEVRNVLADKSTRLQNSVYGDMRNIGKNAFWNATRNENLTGNGLYHQLSNTMADAGVEPRAQKALAASVLRDAGIPGIRYLDGNSRMAGEGSRNYAVFDDSLIEILRKYGLIGMLGGTGALGATQDGDSV